MKLLSILHRWSGGFLGLLLAVLGFSGTLLLWEGEWILLPGADAAVIEDVEAIGRIAEREVAGGAVRITFASEEIGLHQVVSGEGAGAYVRQDGVTVDRWASQWERPELWLFDLHHHLFAGHNGEIVAGWAGVLGLLFLVSGVILWWRSRRAFKPRAWPRSLQPGPVVAHHRDLGILVAPLLLVSFVTGAGMVFRDVTAAVLRPLGTLETRAEPPRAEPATGPAPVAAMLAAASSRFPDARLRRLTVPTKPHQPWSVRMRQPFEWTPNGRTTLSFDGSGTLLRIDDPASASRAAALFETFYPIHSAKVGGLAMKMLMTLSGVGLTILGTLATWSFWVRRARRRSVRAVDGAGLEAAATA